MAVEADNAALAELKSREDAAAHHKKEEIAAAKNIAAQLEGKKFTLTAKAGSGGKLFGAVTSKEIASVVSSETGIEIDRKKLSVKDIKAYGEYTAEIKLYTGITAKFTVEVKA